QRWWHIRLVVQLAHYLSATALALKCMPDLQQHALAVLMPLVIPKSQLLNVPRQKKLFSRNVMSHLVRQTMSETIQFNREAVKRMLGGPIKETDSLNGAKDGAAGQERQRKPPLPSPLLQSRRGRALPGEITRHGIVDRNGRWWGMSRDETRPSADEIAAADS